MVIRDLKYKLDRMGVTMQEMCEKLNISVSTARKWLNGGNISIEHERQVRLFLRGEEPGPADIIGTKKSSVCQGCIHYAKNDGACDYFLNTGTRRVPIEIAYAREHGELVSDRKCVCKERGRRKRKLLI